MSLFKLFERKEVEGGFGNLEGKEVTLPKSKKNVLITNVLNAVDEQMANEEKGEQYADNAHKVKLNEKEVCTVGDMVNKYNTMRNEMERMKNELEEWEKATGGQTAENEMTEEEKKKKAEDEEKVKNEKEEQEKKERENAVAKNQKIREKVARLKGAPMAAFMVNARNSGGSNHGPIQEEVRFKEDAVADGLAHYGEQKG